MKCSICGRELIKGDVYYGFESGIDCEECFEQGSDVFDESAARMTNNERGAYANEFKMEVN